MRKSVIVTGATGFIGANVARRMLTLGHEVHLIVKTGHHIWRIAEIEKDVNIYETGLSDPQRLAESFDRAKPDWVFHLAAFGAYSTQTDLNEMVHTNVLGTANLLDAAVRSGVSAFVNAGTSSEYGFKAGPPSENDILEPNSHYAVTKAAATHLCMLAARTHKLRVPTLRLYSIYGPYEEPTRLIPTLVNAGLDGGLPPLVSPDTSRDYVYVDDAVDAFVCAAENDGVANDGVYNIGTGIQTSLRDVVAMAKNVLPIKDEPVWGSMAGRIWDTSVWVSDNSRAIRELGWEPKHSFEQGLRKMAAWMVHYRHSAPYNK